MAASPSPTTTWPTPSRRSRSSAASTSPTTRLCCFGGAGSQHACQVADLLGIDARLHPPLCRVLSAYGMGLADLRVLRAAGDRAAARRARHRRARGGRGRSSRRRRARAAGAERAGRSASTPRRGSMCATPAPTPRSRCRWPTPRHCGGVRGRAPVPLRLHRRGRGLVVEAVTVEGIGAMEEIAEPELPVVPRAIATPLEPVLRTPIFTTRAPHQPAERFDAAVFSREALQPGDRVDRPGPDLRCHHHRRGRARLGAGGHAARPSDARPHRAAGPAGRGRHALSTRSCSRSSTTCS